MRRILVFVYLSFSFELTPIDHDSDVEVLLSQNYFCTNGFILIEVNVRNEKLWADITWLDGDLKLECTGPAVCHSITTMPSVKSSSRYRLYSSELGDGEMIGLRNRVKIRLQITLYGANTKKIKGVIHKTFSQVGFLWIETI